MINNRSTLQFYKQNLLLFVSVSFLISFYLADFSFSNLNSKKNISSRFNREVLEQIENNQNSIQDIYAEVLSKESINWQNIDELLNHNRIAGYIYFHDSLIYWNTQLSEFFPENSYNCNIDTIVFINNAWFLVSSNSCDSTKIILFNSLNKFFPTNTSNIFHLTEDFSTASFLITDKNNHTIIGLNFDTNKALGIYGYLFLLLLYFGFIISLILWVFYLYRKFKPLYINELILFGLFILDIIIIRGIDYFLDFPKVIKQSYLFQDVITNIPFFTTTGDILLNGVILLTAFIVIYLNNNCNQKTIKKKILVQFAVIILLFISCYSVGNLLIQAAIGLGYDSLLGLEFYTFSGVGIVIVILLYNAALFFLIKVFERIFKKHNFPIITSLIITVILISFIYLFGFFNSEVLLLASLLIIFLLLIFGFVRDSQSINIVKQLLYIIILAAFTTIIVNTDIRSKRDGHQKSSATMLTKESDAELETLFKKSFAKINSDTIFSNLLSEDESTERAVNYLRTTYFQDLNNRFTIQLMACSQGELIKIQPEGFITECSAYFEELIKNSGKLVVDSTFYLIDGETQSIYYVAKIKLLPEEGSTETETVFLEFFSSIVPEGFGYTELLVNKESDSVDLTGYSFAWYQNGQLVYKFGNFPYQTNFDFLKIFENDKFFELMGYRTLKIQISQDKYFVISRPAQQLTEQLATFSLMFIAFGSLILFMYLIAYRRKAVTIFTLNFRARLQFFFIGTISLIIVLFAIITFYYLENSNANRLKAELNEKTQSVIIELQHKLSSDEYISKFDEENLYQLLSKFSMVFFSDINLYDLSGRLLASSRPDIFTRGLQSTQINPKAFSELGKQNQLYYLTEENIGAISYYSSYAPLVVGDNQLIGFVNLPYFARQFDEERSYLLMFSTFINLFVILGIIGTLLALLLSKILIQPLAVLQKSLASIQIEKPNTKIEWNIDDEIGLLIKEYNRMIDKLEQSAILLKHSERESAWREVARQIAHEIKNPLTPMKLNVQYLEKAYLENDPKFDEKIRNISNSLVMQIDTLDKVAEMFSDFAKTKTGNFSKVNLLETVKSCVSLFRNNSNVAIEIIAEENKANYFILAFEKDILRVFNNLLKNSIQSIEGKATGKIEIVFINSVNHIIVEVIDDGKGIADDAKANIFQPYFTTKTGGTGLGLAIVKNIMAEIGGEISFESSARMGTRFILKFKHFNKNSI